MPIPLAKCCRDTRVCVCVCEHRERGMGGEKVRVCFYVCVEWWSAHLMVVESAGLQSGQVRGWCKFSSPDLSPLC